MRFITQSNVIHSSQVCEVIALLNSFLVLRLLFDEGVVCSYDEENVLGSKVSSS